MLYNNIGDNMKSLFKYSKDRSYIVNLIFCILSFLGLFILSGIVEILLSFIIKNGYVCSILSNSILIAFLYLLYLKDLNREAKIYKNNFKENFKNSLKLYFIGFMGMIFFNLIISIFLKNISSNEEQVREMLYNHVFTSLISISIIAPISEELIFRKSLQPIIKNKWLYVFVSGFLFGFAHILTNIISGNFVVSDLMYILPYGSLGASFALMDHDSKTVFSSIVIHALHNTCTALLLLLVYKGGLA